LAISPREYIARKYLIVMGCVCLAALCVFLRFYLGLVFAVLLLVYGLMRHRDALGTRIRKKDAAIAREMPRFVRTICRSLQSDRDLHNAVGAFRKARERNSAASWIYYWPSWNPAIRRAPSSILRTVSERPRPSGFAPRSEI
jgi:hypothetical protein